MKRDSMTFYRDFFDAIEVIPESSQLSAYKTIMRYALDGVEPDKGGTDYAVFLLVKKKIDINNRRYQNSMKGVACKKERRQKDAQHKAPQEPQDKPKAVQKCFRPPSIDEVRAYIAEKGYKVDAERFMDFYDAKGWMIGKNKMKDWKAAVRNWARGQKGQSGRTGQGPNKFHNFKQRDIDYDEIVKQITGF